MDPIVCKGNQVRESYILDSNSTLTILSPQKNINENNYKINQTQDKIGVFVSIISTRTLFKGPITKFVGNNIKKIVIVDNSVKYF